MSIIGQDIMVKSSGEVIVFERPLTDSEFEALKRGALKIVKCKKCNVYFTSRSELMEHIWKKHREKKELTLQHVKSLEDEFRRHVLESYSQELILEGEEARDVLDNYFSNYYCNDNCPYKKICHEYFGKHERMPCDDVDFPIKKLKIIVVKDER